MGSMNFFYRVQREAAQERFLLMEMQGVWTIQQNFCTIITLIMRLMLKIQAKGILFWILGNKGVFLLKMKSFLKRGTDRTGQPLPGYTEPRLLCMIQRFVLMNFS